MSLKRFIILIISVEASVSAGASADNDSEENFLTGLIKSVSENESKNDNVVWPEDIPSDKIIMWPEDRVNNGFVIWPEDKPSDKVVIWPEQEHKETFSAEIDGALSELCSLSALNYLTDAYESADFYANGRWSADGKKYISSSFDGVLPVYDLSDFCHPIHGKITSLYGYREAFHRMHKGVDIALDVGDEVVSALPGVVGRIGYEPGGYGHFVIIVHSGGVETRYAHLNSVTAVLGQKVAAGDKIALGGNSGNSTGPHLHFEVRKNGLAIDPLIVFQELEFSQDIHANR